MRSGSGTGEFTGDNFLAFDFGKIGIGAAGGGKARGARHEPKTLGHGPLFGKAHFAEALELNGMQWLEKQSIGKGERRES